MTGDSSSDLLARIGRGVCLLALHELGDLDSANDVAQETVSRLVRAQREGRLRDENQVGAFARGIARHVILDVIRARKRTIVTNATTLARVESPADDPLTALVTREQLHAVRHALDSLPPADRELLRLTFFDGATSEELANTLHEPAARIRKRKERALERLRRAFFGARSHTVAPAPTSVRILSSHELSSATGLG